VVEGVAEIEVAEECSEEGEEEGTDGAIKLIPALGDTAVNSDKTNFRCRSKLRMLVLKNQRNLLVDVGCLLEMSQQKHPKMNSERCSQSLVILERCF
jgi:hypothetical protein